MLVVGVIFLLSNNANKNQTNTTSTTVTPTAISTPAMQDKTASSTAVTLTAAGFAPQVITVKVGTKVVWTNKSGQMATVNSDPHPIHTAYPPLNLGSFSDSQSLSLVFDKAGKYGYHNHLDASENGTVIVEQ